MEQIFSGILCFRDLVAKKKNATKTLRHKIAQKENGIKKEWKIGIMERKNINRGFKQLIKSKKVDF